MTNEHLISQTSQTSSDLAVSSYKVCICILYNACALRDGRSVLIECGQESSASLETRDRQT